MLLAGRSGPDPERGKVLFHENLYVADRLGSVPSGILCRHSFWSLKITPGHMIKWHGSLPDHILKRRDEDITNWNQHLWISYFSLKGKVLSSYRDES
ncbi:hypothetical protein JMJ77_0009385 [Colletotrichum scovillei]|uniref:Uncharacterized protein n=1 Tax=Colletotrichum scovillei TaxID=1209932 RepID=A0A9P7QY58_9PEZI|nr:hypothetical protein JMJ77_0009385 [Colletotrichum scovillei]KAG7052464.1 hypothetical protein JMJ78_0005480 [Colletotrichum scovillei]KAG7064754.1 hypothetical protein JMJ76_0012512 [Colletotrichum scovillei]